MNNQKKYKTIRELAKTGILPEHAIRTLVKEGKVPGFKVGNRFYIHADSFLEQLHSLGAETR